MAKADAVFQLLAPAVERMGYECVGIEYIPQGKQSILRIYIDGESGVTVDDCVAVSHQVSGILDVEDPISGEYNLEVSSPGMDRPLFTLQQYTRFQGRMVRIRLRVPVNGRRKFKGTIEQVIDDSHEVTLMVDDERHTFALSNIEKANLVPEYEQ